MNTLILINIKLKIVKFNLKVAVPFIMLKYTQILIICNIRNCFFGISVRMNALILTNIRLKIIKFSTTVAIPFIILKYTQILITSNVRNLFFLVFLVV